MPVFSDTYLDERDLITQDNKGTLVLSQYEIKSKLTLFLEESFSKESLTIENFKSHAGLCNGLTILWLYTKWLDNQPGRNNGYNSSWFESIMETIAVWNGKERLYGEVANNLWVFASLIDFFQSPGFYYPDVSQNDLENIMALSQLNTNGKRLKKVHIVPLISTKPQLYEFFKNNIYDDELIYITYQKNNGAHAAGLFKHGENYYYYDSDIGIWEIQKTSVDGIADIIFTANSHYGNDNFPITFEIFSFNDGAHVYHEQSISSTKSIEHSNDNTLIRTGDEEHQKITNIIKLLHNRKEATMHLTNELAQEALNYAAAAGDMEIVKMLFEKKSIADVNKPDNVGDTALILAVINCHPEIVKILLANGADVNFQDRLGKTALMWGVMTPRCFESIKILIENGAEIELTDNKGNAALMHAVLANNLGAVKKLINQGAKVDRFGQVTILGDTMTVTPLMAASHFGEAKMVKILLESGASVNLECDGRADALQLAINTCCFNKYIPEVISKLIEYGANPNRKIEGLFSAIELASDEAFEPDPRCLHVLQGGNFVTDLIKQDLKNLPDFFYTNSDIIARLFEEILSSDVVEKIKGQAGGLLDIINSDTQCVNPELAKGVIIGSICGGGSSYLGCEVAYTGAGFLLAGPVGAIATFVSSQPQCLAAATAGVAAGGTLAGNMHFSQGNEGESKKVLSENRKQVENVDKISEQIGGGHAYSKHIGDFPGFKTKEDLINHVKKIMQDKSSILKELKNGRSAYWHEESKSIVIRDPKHADGGTVFKPDGGIKYFEELK